MKADAIYQKKHAISPNVQFVLRHRIFCHGNALLITGPNLDSNLYREVNKVLELLGGKWNKKQKAHIFGSDAKPLIEAALSDGEVLDKKQSYQFFETPAPIVERMIELAQFQGGESVLEPSAGKGAIALRAKDAGCDVYVCEINSEMAGDLAHAGFKLLVEEGNTEDINADFLKVTPSQDFNAVLMNPPFTRNQDIQHIQHAWKFLALGGRLVAICSGIAFNGSMKVHREFQEWAGPLLTHREWLESGTFKENGTNVAAELIVLECKDGKDHEPPKMRLSNPARSTHTRASSNHHESIRQRRAKPSKPVNRMPLESPEELCRLIREDLVKAIAIADEMASHHPRPLPLTESEAVA